MKKQFSAQPLLNGIIIRKDNHECSATLNNNQIVIKKTHFTDTKQFDNLINIPLMRGIIATINYFTMFIKALNKSADFINTEISKKKSDNPKVMKILNIGMLDAIIIISLGLSFLICFVLFILAPSFIAYIFTKYIDSILIINLIEITFRIILLYIFLRLSSRIKKIATMYKYHGAYHKIINCYQNNDKLTINNIKRHDVCSKECGLSFMFFSMITFSYIICFAQAISGILYTNLIRLILFFLFSGIAYEFFLLFQDKKTISYLGKIFQKTMVLEPSEIEIKVVLASFNTLRKEQDVVSISKSNNE